MFTQRIQAVTESETLRLNSLVQELKAKGKAVYNLTAGEPDFAPPEFAKQKLIEAVHANKSKYTPATGIPELRQLVAQKTNKMQPSVFASKPWDASHVVVTNGGKQAIFNAVLCLVQKGDEVVILSPYWLSYPEIVKFAEGTPRFVHAGVEQGFKVTPKQLEGALNKNTKMVFVNSPSNPTGAVYSKEEFQALGKVIRAHAPQAFVMSDEIYDRIVYGEVKFCSFLEACPEMRDRVITVNGMSKSAAMTGWRIGWSVADTLVTKAFAKLMGQSTSGINSLAQWASVAALSMKEEEFASQVETYRKRRDLVLEVLKKSRKIEVGVPAGAFYVFAGLKDCLQGAAVAGRVPDAAVFAEKLLEATGVAVVPGAPFGAPDFVRLSFATDEKTLQEGCERLVTFAENFRP